MIEPAECAVGRILRQLRLLVPDQRRAALALAGHRSARAWQGPDVLGLHRHLVVTGAWWDLVDPVAADRIGPIVAAHPDDETVGAGRLVAHLAARGRVAAHVATAGEGCFAGRETPGVPDVGELRRSEWRAAVTALGAEAEGETLAQARALVRLSSPKGLAAYDVGKATETWDLRFDGAAFVEAGGVYAGNQRVM